ncbi:MAG: hypothetical protein JNJ70_18165 [Verrucomicrobiales bacterium]|nr:hypothetical protein [Verrucomicrobiales bacterium]
MKRAWKIFKGFLLVWGAVTFIAFVVIGGNILYRTGTDYQPTNKPASKDDVKFVLHFCNLADDKIDARIEEVVHSYASPRSSTGNHLVGHAIRVSQLDASELVLNEVRGFGQWYRGDALDGVAKPAIDFVESCLGSSEMPWFPTINDIRSPNMLVYVWRFENSAGRPFAAQVVLASPSDKMIYYIDVKR